MSDDARLCTRCGGGSHVYDTRLRAGMLIRYRICKACRHRWKTIELNLYVYENMLDEMGVSE